MDERDGAKTHPRRPYFLKGQPGDHERRWYASVILNRLMFIWFLQKKGFLDHDDKGYLSEKLAASMAERKNSFFSHFLRDLFFEGFAKPSNKRNPVGKLSLGDIPYLNGSTQLRQLDFIINYDIKYRMDETLRPPMDGGRLLVLSNFPSGKPSRPTKASCSARNRFVLALARLRYIPHVSPGSSLEKDLEKSGGENPGKQVSLAWPSARKCGMPF